MSVDQLEVVSPLGEHAAKPVASASRINDLSGKTIALVSNGRFQADVVLSKVGDMVRERFPGSKVISYTELPLIRATGDTEVRLKELRDLLKQKGADALISSTGA